MANHPVDIHVGQQLKQIRVTSGMSQEALAKQVGITFQQIQKYEKGANRIGSSRLYEFANILSVDISEFFDGYNGSGSNMLHENSGVALSDVETQNLLNQFSKIKDASTRKKVIDLISVMSE